jgi:outer membrane lipoprotein carrier protein
MKKLFTLLFFSLISVAAIAADYSKFAGVKTITSDFDMERHLAELALKPLISKGKFYFERPGFLRWEYNMPFVSGILLDGGKAYSWKQAATKKEVKDISAQPFAKIMARQIYIFVSMDIEEISVRYNAQETESGLDLLPKDTSAGQSIERIKLRFNKTGDAVEKVEMLEKNGDKTIINFTSTILNAPIPAEVKKP